VTGISPVRLTKSITWSLDLLGVGVLLAGVGGLGVEDGGAVLEELLLPDVEAVPPGV